MLKVEISLYFTDWMKKSVKRVEYKWPKYERRMLKPICSLSRGVFFHKSFEIFRWNENWNAINCTSRVLLYHKKVTMDNIISNQAPKNHWRCNVHWIIDDEWSCWNCSIKCNYVHALAWFRADYPISSTHVMFFFFNQF